MIITGGTLRSRKLQVRAGLRTRPTPARVKEALFSILRDYLAGARVLDLFAGSGALGFEAISRGAAAAVFVESHAPTAAEIRAAASRFGVGEQCTIVAVQAEKSLSRLTGAFDLVFADPPYASQPPLALFTALAEGGFLNQGAVLAYEYPANQPAPELPRSFTLWREEAWGEVGFRLLRKVSSHSEISE